MIEFGSYRLGSVADAKRPVVRPPVYAVCVLISILAGGCAVGPKYKAPSVTVSPFHGVSSVDARKAGLAAPPLDRWWEGFGDPELTRIVQRAIGQNLDLAASLARVDQARAAAKEAGARLKPSGTLNAQSTSFRQSLESQVGRYAGAFPTFSRNQSYLDVGVAASWEIDLFGGLRRGAEAATEEEQAAEAEHLGTRVSVVAEAADAYMQIRGTQGAADFHKGTDRDRRAPAPTCLAAKGGGDRFGP